jgi:hypothetical protein
MDQMISADAEPVAVARDHPDRQVRPGNLEPRGDGRRAAVDAVENGRGDVVRG